MRSVLALALLLVLPNPRFFRETRTIQVPAGSAPQVCTVLDGTVFAHATPTLADLRLYTSSAKLLPYAITISESTLLPPDPAPILNLIILGNRIGFDVQMPSRPYTQLNLKLGGANFLAAAHVSGLHSAGDPHPVPLGAMTLYDLTSRHLSRSTEIPLPESTFPLLHVELVVTPSPGSSTAPALDHLIQSAEVPPARDAQALYTPIARTMQFIQRGSSTVAIFDIPAGVPVERISFSLPANYSANFSRSVQIHATHREEGESPVPSAPEDLTGEIASVRLASAPAIHRQVLSIPAVLVSNVQSPARVELAIQNGGDSAIPFTSATLEMRQRKLCFLATPAATAVTLDYGDPTLDPPVYDLAGLFDPAAPTREAVLSPEQPNPAYTPRLAGRGAFNTRHPETLWLALLGAVGALAVFGFHARSRG